MKKEDIDSMKKTNIAIIGMPGSGDNDIMMMLQSIQVKSMVKGFHKTFKLDDGLRLSSFFILKII